MNDGDSSVASSPTVIKKSHKGVLIDTSRNTYTTLNILRGYAKQGEKFVVLEEPGGKDLTQQVLAQIAFEEDMEQRMRTLTREGKLPYDLLDHHWFRGKTDEIGPHEVRLSPGTEYFPLDGMTFPNGMPATLLKKDYSVERVTQQFERWKEKHREKNQKRIAAGKKADDVEAMTIEKAGLPQQIDGIDCYLLVSWLEEGFNRTKIIDDVLTPLGYSKIRGKKESYQKRLSEQEFLACHFDMAAMWRMRHLRAQMGYHGGDTALGFPLLYWGAFNRVEWMQTDMMDAMMLTTERVFRLAIENIGFLLATLEKDRLESWRSNKIQQL
jgi:hypothetical protein